MSDVKVIDIFGNDAGHYWKICSNAEKNWNGAEKCLDYAEKYWDDAEKHYL